MPIRNLAQRLIAWHGSAGRHDLPWQSDRAAYRVWVSEIMLQQTQVATVIPYFQRFMERFPNADALARSPIDQVLGSWSGLGYYARARNLHKAAQLVASEHAGELPDEIDLLMTLPGIGRSTAGAILALSASRRHPILDGNVKRVLARHFGVHGWPGQRAVEQQLWSLSEACTPAEYVDVYTQAIMDLGATVCRRGKPACQVCPLASTCVALEQGLTGDLPGKRPKKSLPVRRSRWLVARRPDGAVLLEKRAPAGLWGGLWCLPEQVTGQAPEDWGRQHLGAKPALVAPLEGFRHTFSHFHLDVSPILLQMTQAAAANVAEAGQVWYKHGQSVESELGLAAPVQRLLERLERDFPGSDQT
ncbi:MAG: A/G-specific adenine glycosylase [Gammaproteobacteria bacterium]|nr:A/G-specific adenine glycosylase [Gammaproteobacteria bacterium]